MFGVSTFCLHNLPLPEALEKLAAITDRIEVMDDGPHFLETAEPLLSFSGHFSIHTPCRVPISQASSNQSAGLQWRSWGSVSGSPRT